MEPERLHAAMPGELVRLDAPPPSSKQDLFEQVARLLHDEGRIDSAEEFVTALHHREGQGSTFMGEELAIPHGISSTVIRPSIVYLRLSELFAYESAGDDGEVRHVFALAVPEGGAADHLSALAFLARGLIDDEVRTKINEATAPQQVIDAFVDLANRETTV